MSRREKWVTGNARAFTLVEILIVVTVLGILAGVVIPTVGNSSTSAKEGVLRTDLKLLRRFVLIYKGQHIDVGPGYPNGNTAEAPTEDAFIEQATMSSTPGGETAAPGTPGFDRGPYLERMPVNPFNNMSTIQMLADGEDFPANADGDHGWIYKAATSELRADNTGTGSDGQRYYDY